jgi:hypothetical protein
MAKFMPQDEWAYADALCSLAAGGALDKQHQQQQQIATAGKSSPGATCSRVQGSMQHVAAGSSPAAAHAAAAAVGLQLPTCSTTQQLKSAAVEQQQQQQDSLLVMPWWLKALAAVVAGDILSRPDSFRQDATCHHSAMCCSLACRGRVSLLAFQQWRWLQFVCNFCSYVLHHSLPSQHG